MKTKILECQSIFKIYKEGYGEGRIETIALQDVQMDIHEEDFISIVGPSGSGKTTLLNILSGLDVPSAGSVFYHHNEDRVTDVTGLSLAELDKFRIDKFGVIFQMDNLIYHLSARENVELPLKFLGIPDARSQSLELLQRLGLGDRVDHLPSELSAGQRQRVALACALVYKPHIILADEPTGELDSENVTVVMELFKEIHKTEKIVFIIVTHNPLVANYANRTFSIYDGKITEIDDLTSADLIPMDDGKYNLVIDKFNQIIIPPDLVLAADNTSGLFDLIQRENQLILKSIGDGYDDPEGLIVQIGSNNRILLPSNILEIIKGKKLDGAYDENDQSIVINLTEVKND